MKRVFRLGMCVLAIVASGCVAGPTPAHHAAYPTQVVLVFDQPGAVRYLPGYSVYYVPDTPRDIFVVDDVWYHRADRLWYSSSSIEGPWVQIDVVQVPPPVLKLPPAYRDARTPHEDIPWGEWKKGRRRTPEPPPPRDQGPPWGDTRDDRGDRQDRGEDRGPGDDRWDRRDEDRTERPGQPVLVLPPGGQSRGGVGSERPSRRPDPTLPPLRLGRLAYLNRLVRSGVYYIPEIEQEVFLLGETWYRRQDGGWYRASDYDGRWNLENDAAVPRALWGLSPRYREEPMERVRYPLGGTTQPVPPPRPEPPRQPQPQQPPVVVPPPSPTPPDRPVHGKEPPSPATPPAIAGQAKPAQPDQPGSAGGRHPSRESGKPVEEGTGKATLPPRATDKGPPEAGSEEVSRPPTEDRTAPPEEEAGPSERSARSESKPARPAGGKADRLPKMDIPRPGTVRRIPARGVDYLTSGPEILRYQGRWYLRSDGSWYGSGDYAGPWSLLSERDLPQAIRILPGGYRSEPAEDVPLDPSEKGRKDR